MFNIKVGQYVIVKTSGGRVVRGIIQAIEYPLAVLEPRGNEFGAVFDISEDSPDIIAQKELLKDKTRQQLAAELKIPAWAVTAVFNGRTENYGYAPIGHSNCFYIRAAIGILFNMPLKEIFNDLYYYAEYENWATPADGFNRHSVWSRWFDSWKKDNLDENGDYK